ncbi:unnamed protein product [Psylliodes chrysocephalus]|uniref:Uncharacterized protein n=1 Tax=Psylliodes chrysocephalus TaxID=3402493 RepID=A0A9P0CYE4_9CUCU|nr:unnamed protein product [Psylliodes chrysocephala]
MCSTYSFVGVLVGLIFVEVALAASDRNICEYPLFNFTTKNTAEYCRLRNSLYDKKLWNYYAGCQCYVYTNRARLKFLYPTALEEINVDGEVVYIPVANVTDLNRTATYDHRKKTDLSYIRRSFKNDAVFNNYVSCCKEAESCCFDAMTNGNINSTSTHCPAIWDAWTCFHPTKANTVARYPCSSQAYQAPDEVCTLESEKQCILNTTTQLVEWVQQTDYTVCAIAPVYTRRYNFHIIFLGICIGFCVPAICIFFLFEKLRKTIRVILHRNLLIAICVRNVFTILSKKLVILDQLKSPLESSHRMEHNGVACRILAFLETSSVNTIYACMFLDAYYLHKVIVRAFAKETKKVFIYSILLGMTFIFSLCWAIAMAAKKAENCWMVNMDGLQWTLDGFRIAVLMVNTILLADIIRVMILKLKHGSTTKQTMAAFRATIFLIPLFGLHIMITAKKNCL